MSTPEKPSMSLDRWIQTSGVLIGLIALIVTVYFSVKADKLKEISISYLNKQALVAIENAHSKSGIEVRLSGNSVGAPWLVSGRVENSGNTPIEERDIESPLRITFEGGKLLSADIGSKRNADVFAASEIQGNTFIVKHKLLNPGDWIGFDLIFDGEPKIPATLAVRISGVETGLQRVSQPEKYQSHLSLIAIPRPAFVMALTLLSLLFVALGLAGCIGLWDFCSCALKHPRKAAFSRRLSRISVAELVEGFAPSTKRGKIIWPYLEMPSTAEQIDDITSLEQQIEKNIPQTLRHEFIASPTEAASELRGQLRTHIQSTLASRLYTSLPNGFDRYHRASFRARDFSDTSTTQLIESAVRIAADPTAEVPLRNRFDPQDLVMGLTCIGLAVAAVFVLGGTWRTFLSN